MKRFLLISALLLGKIFGQTITDAGLTTINNFSSAGVFTNVQMNETLVNSINNCSTAIEQTALNGAGQFATNGLSVCVKGPTTPTVPFLNAISGYIQSNHTGSSPAATAITGQARCLGNDSSCLGGSFIAADATNANTNMELFGIFAKVVTFNSAAGYQIIRGVDAVAQFTSQPTTGAAFEADTANTNSWLIGFYSPDGSSSTFATAGGTCVTGACSSQATFLEGYSGAHVIHNVSYAASSNGDFSLSPASGRSLVLTNGDSIASGNASNTDLNGQLTFSAATTSNTYTFNGTYTSAPICTISSLADPVGRLWISTLNTTSLQLTDSSTVSITVDYQCSARN